MNIIKRFLTWRERRRSRVRFFARLNALLEESKGGVQYAAYLEATNHYLACLAAEENRRAGVVPQEASE